jgi:hypothetical protein
MSKAVPRTIVCQQCNNQPEAVLFHTVHGALDPGLKTKVLDTKFEEPKP